MKMMLDIELMGCCEVRIEAIKQIVKNRQYILKAKIERDAPYEEIRLLKAEIDSLLQEMEQIKVLYDYYDEKLF